MESSKLVSALFRVELLCVWDPLLLDPTAGCLWISPCLLPISRQVQPVRRIETIWFLFHARGLDNDLDLNLHYPL
jgi:hypothetical protein